MQQKEFTKNTEQQQRIFIFLYIFVCFISVSFLHNNKMRTIFGAFTFYFLIRIAYGKIGNFEQNNTGEYAQNKSI